MTLSARDAKLLREIIDGGQLAAAATPNTESFTKLRILIADLAGAAESAELRRLSIHERDIREDLSPKHLAGIMVPFERLAGRALRDDEILVTADDSIQGERAFAPLIVIAENLRSSFNVGSLFRTAEAFGAEQLILTGYTPSPEEARTAKTSMGADQYLPWKSAPSARVEALRLKNAGYEIVALETAELAHDLGHYEWPAKTVLLVGNERFGLDAETLRIADHVVKIPLVGRKNSLNVGIALGIALADWRRPRRYRSIGTFHASTHFPYQARRQGVDDKSGEIGVIELHRGHQFEQALRDLDGFERIWINYDFHLNDHWKPLTQPPRGPKKKRGVFGTRAPYRPNPLGLSCVELVEIKGLQIFIRGFDLLDGSPVLDIKPYIPSADSFPNARAGWTEGLTDERLRVDFKPLARRQLDWLAAEGLNQLEAFIVAQLEYNPTDKGRKRVVADGSNWILAYRTWRTRFLVTDSISVLGIESGYDEQELATTDARAIDRAIAKAIDSADVYGDKPLHRRFVVENFG